MCLFTPDLFHSCPTVSYRQLNYHIILNKGFTSSFAICILFISISCLIIVAKTSVLYWIGVRIVDNLVLLLILVEISWVSLYLSWYWLWNCCKLPLLCCGIPHIPSVPISASIEMTMLFVSFSLLIEWITFIDLHMLNYICFSGIMPI